MPTVLPTMDAVQLLASVNTINPEAFRNTDKLTLKTYFPKVFLQKVVSDDIYNAIASKSGSAQTKEE